MHGKAAQISTWTFHSVRIFASLIHRKYTAQNVALPKWWTQWLAFVDICALVRPAFTNERWARTLGNRVAEHMEMVMAIPTLAHLVTKKNHGVSHFPGQGLAYAGPDTLSEYRLEGEHQPHKRSARNGNRRNTLMTMMQDYAIESALAIYSGETQRYDVLALRAPQFSVEYYPGQLAMSSMARILDVLNLADRVSHPDQATVVHRHTAVSYMGKAFYLGGWAIVDYTPHAHNGTSLNTRLVQVDAIFEVTMDQETNVWCISLNVFPMASLVTLDTGQMVSMDPCVLADSQNHTDSQITILLERTQLKRLVPVMKCYGSLDDTIVKMLPEY